MTERIDERLQAMGVDASEMTNEQKFTAATGLTRYAEYEANNPWYVPGGAANVPVGEAEPSGESEASGPSGSTESSGPTGSTESSGPSGSTESSGPTGSTESSGPTGEAETGQGNTEASGPSGSTGEVIVEDTTGASGPSGSSGPNDWDDDDLIQN